MAAASDPASGSRFNVRWLKDGVEGARLTLRAGSLDELKRKVRTELNPHLSDLDGFQLIDRTTSAVLRADTFRIIPEVREVLLFYAGMEGTFEHGEYRPPPAATMADTLNKDLDNLAALNELVENAIEYARPNSTKRDPNKVEITITPPTTESGGVGTIEIADNGIGMTDQQVRGFITTGRSHAHSPLQGPEALEYLGGKIGVYGIGKLAGLFFGENACMELKTRTHDSPVYTRTQMSKAGSRAAGAMGADLLSSHAVAGSDEVERGASWTVITLTNVPKSFFDSCARPPSVAHGAGGASGGAASASSSAAGSRRRRRGGGGASAAVPVRGRAAHRLEGKEDDNFTRLRHSLANKYFFYITGQGKGFLAALGGWEAEHDVGDAHTIQIVLNKIRISQMDSSMRRAVRCIGELQHWGADRGKSLVTANGFFPSNDDAPLSDHDWKRIQGKLLFSPPYDGDDQIVRRGEAFDRVPLEVYRPVRRGDTGGRDDESYRAIGVTLLRSAKRDHDRVVWIPFRDVRRAYRRLAPKVTKQGLIRNPGAKRDAKPNPFWREKQYKLPLAVYCHKTTGASCSKGDPNAVLVAEILLLYLPSVEIEGEAIELLDTIGGFAADQDMLEDGCKNERWAKGPRLVTVWNSLVLAKEHLLGVRCHSGRRSTP